MQKQPRSVCGNQATPLFPVEESGVNQWNRQRHLWHPWSGLLHTALDFPQPHGTSAISSVRADVQCCATNMRNNSGTISMDDPRQRRLFQRKLLKWYELNRRNLPWRANRDPYRVWVSEIMLQQTRVAAVIPHYQKFLRRFPTVHKLAAAREPSVLAAWSGLGYYRRARMLHAASKKVVRQYSGQFPDSPEELRKLPGIGRYTAAAIASIAYGKPVAVVDGNVRRVLERFLGRTVAPSQLWQIAERLLYRENPGDFNQALMELGATLCLPKEPNCRHCPVKEQCATRGSFPKVKIRTRQIRRTICYTLDRQNGSVFLVKRSDNEPLMPGMWELPERDGPTLTNPRIRLRHSITVTDFEVLVTQGPAPRQTSGQWVKENRVEGLPLTGLAKKILRAARVI
jgi:A/G-specific adenine glycosylase